VIILAYILFGLGVLVSIVGEVMFLTAAYRRSVLWFLGSLFLPVVWLVFFLMHLKETWKPVLMCMSGFVVSCLGYWAGGFQFLS